MKRALYFGCRDEIGHYLCSSQGRTIWDTSSVPGFPWSLGHLDGGLLNNGRHPDIYDGKVFWTCGGTPLWLAFVWWDNSVDRRGASNSGFYVQGFDVAEFPKVVARQRQPLVVQP